MKQGVTYNLVIVFGRLHWFRTSDFDIYSIPRKRSEKVSCASQ